MIDIIKTVLMSFVSFPKPNGMGPIKPTKANFPPVAESAINIIPIIMRINPKISRRIKLI